MATQEYDTVFVILSGEHEIIQWNAHRQLFGSWSNSFKDLLFCQRFDNIAKDKGGQKPWIWLKNVSPETFDWVYKFVYNDFQPLNDQNIVSIIKFTYEYGMIMLGDWLFNRLCDSLNKSSMKLNVIVSQFIHNSIEPQIPQLLHKIQTKKQFIHLLQTKTWYLFNSQQIINICIKSFNMQQIVSTDVFFTALKKWCIVHSPANQKWTFLMSNFITYIDWSNMSPLYFINYIDSDVDDDIFTIHLKTQICKCICLHKKLLF